MASVIVPTRDRPDRLRRCLQALEAQTAGFEVVVVDDGSVDAVAVADVGPEHVMRLVVSWPRVWPPPATSALPRPAGGCCASRMTTAGWSRAGSTPSPVAARGAHVVAGPTVTAMTDNPYSVAPQTVTNHLMDESCDDARGTAGFAPTSNVACLAEVWRAVLRRPLPVAAEDRDWFAWPTTGSRCTSSLRRGCGTTRTSHSGRSGASRCATAAARPVPPAERGGRPATGGRFYIGLVRAGFAHGAVVGALVVLAQVATAWGIATEAVRSRRRRV